MRYETYKAAIIAQGSYCYMTRAAWEQARREAAEGRSVVFEVTSDKAILKRGWHKNVFLPGDPHNPITFGPFATEEEAAAS
jgi:hypothetical protein